MIISWPYLLLWRRRILWYFFFILARRRFGALVECFFFIVRGTDRTLRNHRKREGLFLSSRCCRENFDAEVPSLVIFFPHTETTGHIVILAQSGPYLTCDTSYVLVRWLALCFVIERSRIHSLIWRSVALPYCFQALWQSFEKRPLTSSWLSFRLNNLTPTGRIFIKFCIWVFFQNLSRKFKSD